MQNRSPFVSCSFVQIVTVLSCSHSILYFRDRSSVKAGIHTCVSSTHNGARCLSMYEHQCSQTIPAFAIKACALATKSHMLNFCRGLCAICRECDLWKLITQVTKRFSVLRKKEQCSKQRNTTTTFGKSLFLTQYRMRNAIYIPPNTKDRVINLTMETDKTQ